MQPHSMCTCPRRNATFTVAELHIVTRPLPDHPICALLNQEPTQPHMVLQCKQHRAATRLPMPAGQQANSPHLQPGKLLYPICFWQAATPHLQASKLLRPWLPPVPLRAAPTDLARIHICLESHSVPLNRLYHCWKHPLEMLSGFASAPTIGPVSWPQCSLGH
jgi:hypothetical protein